VRLAGLFDGIVRSMLRFRDKAGQVRPNPTFCPLGRLRSYDDEATPGADLGQNEEMSARVLIVEDDGDVRAMLRVLLEDDDYIVSEAADGDTAISRTFAEQPDLVLLDLRLPGRHGLDVCRVVRQRSNVPILVVSAQADSVDVVAALEGGADDYVTKPFVARELSARVRALLRRASEQRAGREVIHVGDLEVRPAEGVVRKRGELVELTRTELRVLCELANHEGAILSRDQLLERVWGYESVGDARTVDAHIRRLRMKIEDDPSAPRLLQTVRGLGYKLVDNG
jgi:DNA-binding response OmpR family regulator